MDSFERSQIQLNRRLTESMIFFGSLPVIIGVLFIWGTLCYFFPALREYINQFLIIFEVVCFIAILAIMFYLTREDNKDDNA